MPPDPKPPTGAPRRPRAGDVLSDAGLAEAARAALDAEGVTHAQAAEALGLKQTAVTMALNPEKYPNRGHAARRAILRRFARLDLDGPLYRLRKAGEAGGDAAGDAGAGE